MEDKSSRFSLNLVFDALPRVSFSHHAPEVPAWRSCGLAGFYIAVLTVLGAGLLAGQSLLVLSCVILVSVGSFFAYGLLRKWITRRERFVLLEHVWAALLVSAGTLTLMGEQVLPYLDLFSVGLAMFLAGGRAGCLTAGCCFGRPASVGVVYEREHVKAGFPNHLRGVRLFPVQLIEMAGLLLIGTVGLAMLGVTAPGTALAWFLISYSVMRFGLEGLRGDRRPHWFAFSQAQWMSVLQAGAALLWLQRGDWTPERLAAAGLLWAVLACAAAIRHRRDPRRRLLSDVHVAEVRTAAEPLRIGSEPYASRTSEGVSVAVSLASGWDPETAHLSLGLPDGKADLRLLCDLAHRAYPSLLCEAATYSSNRVLHFLVPLSGNGARPATRADDFYGAVLRDAQSRDARIETDERLRSAPRGAGSVARKLSDSLDTSEERKAPELRMSKLRGGNTAGHWRFRI